MTWPIRIGRHLVATCGCHRIRRLSRHKLHRLSRSSIDFILSAGSEPVLRTMGDLKINGMAIRYSQLDRIPITATIS
jgi:hypothetical protein